MSSEVRYQEASPADREAESEESTVERGWLEYLKRWIGEIGVITKLIVTVNVLVFILESYMDWDIWSYVINLYYLKNGEYFRLISYQFSHINWFHILTNMLCVVLYSPEIEKHHGFWKYLLLNFLLCAGQTALMLLMVYGMTYVPEALYGGEFYYYYSPIGYSGVIYGYITLWCYIIEDEYLCSCCIIPIKAKYAPWILLIIDQIICFGVSFICHLSGILAAHLIRVFLFTKDEKILGEGKSCLSKTINYIRGRRNVNYDITYELQSQPTVVESAV
ncbi:unnamed protein product [Moneuplotes crassus]|uniref:Peptidase S54 rhomboid domain-containing protein n=1 Tax=Euplotes crassus TaxID=5936 RepID=A0AAD1XRM3_EUPCR|nr:unnamed protein product [Moneuplotes crassus]